MAYTTTIMDLVESGYKIFDFDYPLFDPAYKPVFEQKFIDRFYFREIGFETAGRFKHYLRTRLNEIMPYYNEQYRQLELFQKMDPYINKDLTVTQQRSIDQETEGKNRATSVGSTIYSDTPQARLQGKDYATNLTENSDESDGVSETTAKTTEEYIENIKGFDGMKYAVDVYEDIKKAIINIDTMILDELETLFMSIY